MLRGEFVAVQGTARNNRGHINTTWKKIKRCQIGDYHSDLEADSSLLGYYIVFDSTYLQAFRKIMLPTFSGSSIRC